MSLGVAIHHVRRVAREDREVRTDHVCFVGVVARSRWPEGLTAGDYVEIRTEELVSFEAHPATSHLDAATRIAVRSFYVNGGQRCTVLGVCIVDARDLTDPVRADSAFAAVLDRLRDDDDVALLAMPPLAWLPIRRSGGQVLVDATVMARKLLAHCKEMTNRFLLLDAPRGAEEEDVVAWAEELRAQRDLDPSYAALYWPWIQSKDVSLAPSGAVAGIYARVDRANGPWGVRIAPANQEVRGYTHPTVEMTWRQASRLVEQGVNPLLEQPGRGLVVWGARTLSRDVRWQQITSRRIVGMITERVRRDAEWVVFETQRPELWEVVARMVRTRLDGFWRAGLLTGEAEGNEYLVQCDAELNPPSVRDAGQVHFKVLLRPVASTEFIEVELAVGA